MYKCTMSVLQAALQGLYCKVYWVCTSEFKPHWTRFVLEWNFSHHIPWHPGIWDNYHHNRLARFFETQCILFCTITLPCLRMRHRPLIRFSASDRYTILALYKFICMYVCIRLNLSLPLCSSFPHNSSSSSIIADLCLHSFVVHFHHLIAALLLSVVTHCHTHRHSPNFQSPFSTKLTLKFPNQQHDKINVYICKEKLKFMIALIVAIFRNTHPDYCWSFSGIWISCKKITASSFLILTAFGAQFMSDSYILARAYTPCSAVCLWLLTYLYRSVAGFVCIDRLSELLVRFLTLNSLCISYCTMQYSGCVISQSDMAVWFGKCLDFVTLLLCLMCIAACRTHRVRVSSKRPVWDDTQEKKGVPGL